MQHELAQGWNTRSGLSHGLLPGGFAWTLGIRGYVQRRNVREALIGRRGGGTDSPPARNVLAEKSAALLMKEWLEKGHVHEN